MKKFSILIMILFMYQLCFAQQNVQYFILTSYPAHTDQGISKIQTSKDIHENYGAIFFRLSSRNRDFRLSFIHVNHNLTELAKIRQPRSDDQMTIQTVTQSFVDIINPIDLDVLFATWTKEQAKAFYKSMRGKKIYIIDRSTRVYVQDNQFQKISGSPIPIPITGHFEYKVYQVRHAIPPDF